MRKRETANLGIPSFDDMMLPTLHALQKLGGSGANTEIFDTVVEMLCLPNDVLDIPHRDTSQSEVQYRLHWSRSYLKKYGLIDNSERGVWSLVSANADLSNFNAKEVVRFVRDIGKNKIDTPITNAHASCFEADEEDDTLPWHQQLHKILLAMPPDGFERLAQRLLREAGFIQVDVTGKSSDGGIDGIGIVRIAGFLRFHVLFQCKRYQGSITPIQIRDFRGAMQGRTDKGLFITTGTFSREAIKEAGRDGAPPIDLMAQWGSLWMNTIVHGHVP